MLDFSYEEKEQRIKLSDTAFREIGPLCTEHKRIAKAWRDNFYKPSKPTEWPGGAHILDSRTTHAERGATWDRKNAEQIKMTAECCRSGNSPQCS